MNDDSIDYDDDDLMDPLPEEIPYFFRAFCGLGIVAGAICGLVIAAGIIYSVVHFIWNLFI